MLSRKLFHWQHRYAPYVFVAPFIVVFCTFGLYPLVKSLVLSFYITSGPRSRVFVGLANFAFLLSDPDFLKAVRNTATFAAFSVFLQLPLSLGLALLLNRKALGGRNVFRLVFFSPRLVGMVFVAVLFTVIFQPQFGLLNRVLYALVGLDPSPTWFSLTKILLRAMLQALPWVYVAVRMIGFHQTFFHGRRLLSTSAPMRLVLLMLVAALVGVVLQPEIGLLDRLLVKGLGPFNVDTKWLGNASLVMPALVLTSLWMYVGFNMIYFLAALQNVDQQLYDAAMVDGANAWQRFWHVTLPSIKPVAVFVVVLSTIGSFQLFELPYLMLNNGGGPENAGLTVVMYLYQNGFETGDLGYASAIGWTLALGVLIISLIQMRVTGAWKRD